MGGVVGEIQLRKFRRPVLVLNPRSGSVAATREQLLEAARRFGVEVLQATSPAELAFVCVPAGTRNHFARWGALAHAAARWDQEPRRFVTITRPAACQGR